WVFAIKVERDAELLAESEYMLPLNEDQPCFLYSDHETRGYSDDSGNVSANHIRNFVLVVPDEYHDSVMDGEAWLLERPVDAASQWRDEWPRSLGRASFERIIANAAHVQSNGLHAYIYSDAGDSIELLISR